MDRAVELQQMARLNAAETEAAMRELMQWEVRLLLCGHVNRFLTRLQTSVKMKDKEISTMKAVLQV
jgi:hypothetical protein